jgi:hypothetical protein
MAPFPSLYKQDTQYARQSSNESLGGKATVESDSDNMYNNSLMKGIQVKNLDHLLTQDKDSLMIKKNS